MIRLVLASTAVVLAVAAGSASAAGGTQICGQIKNGPSASYWSSVSGIRLKSGSTWTVLATGVRCGFAVKASKSLFGAWKAAKIGGSLKLKGYTCVKMTDRTYDGKGISSGGGLCHVGATPGLTPFAPNTFAFRMTGPYTITQIKAFFHLK